MKLCLLFFSMFCSFAFAGDSMTVGWLRRGLSAAIIVNNNDSTAWTPSASKAFSEVGNYYMGFIHGMNGSLVLSDKPSPLTSTPEDMLDVGKQAASVLTFINNHKELTNDSAARIALLAWYLQAHPKSGEFEKRASAAVLLMGTDKAPTK